MEKSDLVVGQTFDGVLAKLVEDHDGRRKRVRTMPGQIVPAGLYVECSKRIRERNPLGTIFKINVGVSRKPDSSIYLHSLKKQELLTVDEWEQTYGGRPISGRF